MRNAALSLYGACFILQALITLPAQTPQDITNRVFHLGLGCSGSTMICYANKLVFHQNGTYTRATMSVQTFTLETGNYTRKNEVIETVATQAEEWEIPLNDSAKSPQLGHFVKSITPSASKQSYKITVCEEKYTALQIITPEANAWEKENRLFVQKDFEEKYIDKSTKEILCINGEITASNDAPQVTVKYINPRTQQEIPLEVISYDKNNRTLVVKFPNSDKKYTLSYAHQHNGLACLNPNGTTQKFERDFTL